MQGGFQGGVEQIDNLRYHSYWLPFWVRSARGGEDRFTRL